MGWCLRIGTTFEHPVLVMETHPRKRYGEGWRKRDWAWTEIGDHLAMWTLYFEEAWLVDDVQVVDTRKFGDCWQFVGSRPKHGPMSEVIPTQMRAFANVRVGKRSGAERDQM